MSDYETMREALEDSITARTVLLIMLRSFQATGAPEMRKLPLELQLKLSQHFEAMRSLLKETK